MEQFYTLVTDIGKAKIANATALQKKLELSKIVLGDSNGSYYEPTESQNKLKNQVWKGEITDKFIDKENKNWIVIQTIIPSTIGGFTIREAGIVDADGDLVVIAKYPETYKPKMSDGSTKDITINLILEVSNVENVTLKVDPTIIFATKEDLKNINKTIKENDKKVSSQYEDLKNYNKNYYKNFGVNLIKNSGYIKDLKYWVQQTGGGAEQKDFCIKTGYNDLMSGASLTCTKMVEHGWCILANASLIDNKFKFIIGETYTISGYIWSNKDSTVGLQICDGNAGNFVFGKEMKCTSGYNYFCYTFKPKITGNENQIRFTLQGNTTIYIPFIKLEIGNIATPWSKNHLENLEEIDSLDSKFTLKNAGDITDFNKVLSENEYRVGNSVGVANAPYTGQIYGKLLVYVDTGNTHNNINNWIWQIFMNTRGETYKRRKTNNSEWSQWIQLPERQEIIAINKRLDAIEQTLIEKGFNIAKSRLNI